jgi:hypothetical protein
MKKIITLILAACTLCLAGCSNLGIPTADSQKAAIESVLAQRAKIEKEQAGSLSGERVAALMAIDVHSCPADFRSAWFDYLVEVHELDIRVERVADVGLAVGKPVSDLSSLIKFAVANPRVGEYLLAAVSKVDDAWGKVERTGMNYGVMPDVDGGEMRHRPDIAPKPGKNS